MQTLTAGTDAAGLVLVWPETWTDADRVQFAEDPAGTLERLHQAGRLLHWETHADGHYVLGVLREIDPPTEWADWLGPPLVTTPLRIAGPGRFTGQEWALDPTGDTPHAACDWPAGSYRATLWELKTPEDHEEHWLRRQVGPRRLTYWHWHGTATTFTLMALVLSLTGLAWAPRPLAGIAILLCLLGLLGLWLASRQRWYRVIRRAQNEYETSFPSYLLRLERVDLSTDDISG